MWSPHRSIIMESRVTPEFKKEDTLMALSNIASWNNGTVSSACGAADKPAEEKKAACGAACGAADKPAEAPAACGAADKPAEAPAACGAADK